MEEKEVGELRLILGRDDRVWGLTTEEVLRMIERERECRWRKPDEELPPKGTDVLILRRRSWFPEWGTLLSAGWYATRSERLDEPPCYWLPMTALPDLPEEPNDDRTND